MRTTEPERYLEMNLGIEDPLVLQLGGSCPSDMKTASAMAAKLGIREININAGCPSEKVSGKIESFHLSYTLDCMHVQISEIIAQ